MTGLIELKAFIDLCNRCGFCQDVCPTYGVFHNELDVARGRIHTLKKVLDGRYDPLLSPEIPVQVDQCLLCGACTANCPSGVPTDRIIQAVRTALLDQKGFSLFHSLLYRGILDRQARLERIIGLVRLLDHTGLRNQVARNAALAALPLATRAATALPGHLDAPASIQLGPKYDTRTGGICYFMGCGTNVLSPDTGITLVHCLESLGFEVSVPRVPCCGGPHFSAGDMNRARRLARENIDLIFDLDPEAIVTDCATCAHTLHNYGRFFPKEDPIQEKIKWLKGKMVDIHGFLAHHLALSPIGGKGSMGRQTMKVTYHDPCHAVRGMGISQSPRDLLESLPGVRFVEMDGADTCCGGAGSYGFRHPGMSDRILDRKIDAIVRTGADLVATSCPSCFLQIAAGLRRRQLSVRVTHPVTLAARVLGAAPQSR